MSLKYDGAVDDDEVVVAAERLEDLLDAAGGDQLGHLGRRRREQDPDAGRVVDDERVDRLELAGLELGDEVGDRLVLRVQVEQDADVAELERAVHEDDLLAELGGRGDGQVDRDRRPADAALRAEDRDDDAGLAGLAGRRRGRAAGAATAAGDGGHPALLVALAGARPGGSTR